MGKDNWYESDDYLKDIWENYSDNLVAFPNTTNELIHWIAYFDKFIPTEYLRLFLKSIKLLFGRKVIT